MITLRISRGFAHKVEEFAQFLSETGLELGSNLASEKLGFDSVAFVADLFDTLLQQTRVKPGHQECESSIVPKCVNKTIEDTPDKIVQASERPRRRPRRRSRGHNFHELMSVVRSPWRGRLKTAEVWLLTPTALSVVGDSKFSTGL